eukprot:TRINITY_DN2394_c0_g1_i4.p1 TRINITY_DN2394_c0_g1~~TRINITY_DN2394_c0_g1_i4.p1  ORF type:complete len:514 (-),score=49.98 TRINITY_DN2394_c0_g1_i4:211-1647(-)
MASATAAGTRAALSANAAVLASSSSISSRSALAAAPLSRPSSAAKRLPLDVRCHGAEEAAATTAVDGRAFRRQLNKSDNYNRSGFGFKKEMLERMEQEYTSDVVKTLRENNNEFTWGDVTIMLAESLGFCWGVERAVQMAYEARKQFPDQKIWVTNEIIHNPTVNERMETMGMSFIETKPDGTKEFEVVTDDSVVLLPAFGASLQEVTMLHDRNVQMVDTTCPWVSKVWDTVDKHKRGQYTSVIHGKYAHEETVATASYAGTYIVVKDMKEAHYVCDYVLGGKLDGSSGTREEFLEKFKNAVSAGFDPDTDLVRLGIANQTTMLKGETEMIGRLLEKTMMEKYGAANVNEHFMSFNTICDATQERQDAMYSLVEKPMDLMLVVGGLNSSNTSHLQEIAEQRGIPSYWVDEPTRVGPGNRVTHKLYYGELKETVGFLPAGPIRIGVTSGASTPDKVVEDVLNVIFAIKREMAAEPQAVA